MLWFDVEERYKTMKQAEYNDEAELWFDVEERYKTISRGFVATMYSCGLM